MSGRAWWQEGAIYQLVVPSFFDGNGDGLGDLDGLLARLDYLEWLGIDAVWLSPCYPSPLHELGYDVSDYCDIEPRFGSLESFGKLLDEAHRREMRVILDWVANHTAVAHPWFQESKASRTSARRNWYVWRDARPDGSPPNNWVSVFGGSAWQWDDATSQYYLHTFLDSQPDLNWREPGVREAILAAMRFWLDRGVDGFRLDAAPLLLKDPELRDNPPNPDFKPGDLPDSSQLPLHTRNQPGLHETFAEFRAELERYPGERVLLGEFYVPFEELATFYGSAAAPELHLPLNLSLTWTQWRADIVGKTIADYQTCMQDRWPTTTLDTHDQMRIAMRAGPEHCRIAALLLLTQRGTPTLYYGDEIGMRGVSIPAREAVDPQGRRTGHNRDPARTPMQWSAERHAGFTTAEPWLPASEDAATVNVTNQAQDAGSLLTLYRRLIELRRSEPALRDGVQEPVFADPTVLVYRRRAAAACVVVALNFGADPASYEIEGEGTVLVSSSLDRDGEVVRGQFALKPHEGLAISVAQGSRDREQ